ncbi:MAG TPA: histidine phosphatase family protein [Bacillota bacterium]|nr:histidine phosphatase family protein [Bacillota bacterium]
MARLLVVRHGETMFNREKRFQGWLDIPLSDFGSAQATACASYLATSPLVPVSRVYSSPLCRARQTAKAIAEALGADLATDERLREIDVGKIAGMTWEDTEDEYPKFMEEYRRDPIATRYPGGESVLDVWDRAGHLLRYIAETHRAETVVVVGHAIILKALICHILHLDVPNHRRMTLGNASLSVAEVGMQGRGFVGRVIRLNDRHYLEYAGLDTYTGHVDAR